MKIAHVTSELCRASAGLGVAVAGMSAAIARAGNEVQVFGLSSANWVDGDSAAWIGAPAAVFDSASWSGPLGYAPGMLDALMEFDPDVLHLHGLWTYPSIAAHRWHRKSQRPLVVSAHGMLTPVALDYRRWRKRIARWLFQDRVLQAATVLHSTSSDEEASYRALGLRNRVASIALGVDVTPPPQLKRDGFPRRLLFVGRLHHVKGIDWLIDAWTGLERDFPNWELSIVGPIEPGYEREINRLKEVAAGKRVNFAGPLHGDEKNRHIATAELFAMPSRSENFGLTAAEALTMEVPVIATKGTPWSGLVDADAGWWIDPGAAPLEQAMREAMQLPAAELRRKGRNGRDWIQRDFSWPVIGAKWQRVYEMAIGES